ncbi:MAG TPA: MmgE/PrpD family protein [Rhodoblastus sp.]|nr:MmgE/PrpD family protein [Rhodoblastus sp.]
MRDIRKHRSVAERFAAFARRMKDEALPDAVVRAACEQVLDTVGVGLAARRLDAEKPAVVVATERWDDGGAYVLGEYRRAPAQMALLANGALSHALDFDNTHMGSMIHVGAAVAPTAWTLGACRHAAGADVIRAYVAGVECATRLGLASPGAFHANGFHATAVAGVFGAVTAAGMILGASERNIVDALGIAGSMAAGLLEYHHAGSSNKKLHPGLAASQAYLAVRLAMAGADGPETVFEGGFGLIATHLGDVDPDFGTDDLGSLWHVLEVTTKPYPICNLSHAALDCVRAIQKENPDLRADAIAAARVWGPPGVVPLVVEPVAAKIAPRNAYEAKFSIQHCVARMLVDRAVSVDHFTPEMVGDIGVRDLAARVSFVPEPNDAYPRKMPGRVEIVLADGRVLTSSVEDSAGSSSKPLSRAEIEEKFRNNLGESPRDGGAGDLAEEILGLWECADVEPLVRRFSSYLQHDANRRAESPRGEKALRI